MKRILVVSMIVMGLFFGLLFVVRSFSTPDLCGNEIIQTIESPNKDYMAYVFTRDCGATTRASYQLSVIKNGKKVDNKSGNALVSYSPFKITWKSSDELNVSFDKHAETFKKEVNVGRVKISYANYP